MFWGFHPLGLQINISVNLRVQSDWVTLSQGGKRTHLGHNEVSREGIPTITLTSYSLVCINGNQTAVNPFSRMGAGLGLFRVYWGFIMRRKLASHSSSLKCDSATEPP